MESRRRNFGVALRARGPTPIAVNTGLPSKSGSSTMVTIDDPDMGNAGILKDARQPLEALSRAAIKTDLRAGRQSRIALARRADLWVVVG